MNTRNYIDEEIEFKFCEDINLGIDKEFNETVKLKIDNEGNGETTFTIPTNSHWKGAHEKGKDGVPRYFYLKEVKKGIEFPRAYYVTNPNKTEEENKSSSKRVKALMLKVAKTLKEDTATEANSAAILGLELNLPIGNQTACESLIWGSAVSCDFRKKLIEICADLWGEEKKVFMANNLMAVFAWESGGTFKTNVPNMGNSGGTGLIQFMPKTAKSLLGKDIDIEYVKNYWGKEKT